jgi:methylenetetrahydrofolate dehydrogenase (NADP+)/methenyltetrahydrofolate cyclohydrolase
VTALPGAFIVEELPNDPHDVPVDLSSTSAARGWARGMSAKVIDGKAIAQAYRAELALRVERLREGGTAPGLAVVIVGDDPASKVYVRNKALASEASAFARRCTASRGHLAGDAHRPGEGPECGPVGARHPRPAAAPRHIAAARSSRRSSPTRTWTASTTATSARSGGRAGVLPVHAVGDHEDARARVDRGRGRHAVVVGRSNIVGKPMALMLLQAGRRSRSAIRRRRTSER